MLTHAQKDARKIGGSDAAIIANGEMYGKTLYDLWLEKTGRRQPENLDWSLPVRMGQHTESLNRVWYEHETGNRVHVTDATFVHPDHDFMTAHFDGLIGDDGLFEAKHISGWNSKDQVQAHYAQLQHCMAVGGLAWAALSVFKGTTDYLLYTVERDDDYIRQLIELESAFWFCVESDDPPEGFGHLDAPAPEPEKEYDFTGNNEWAALADDFLTNAAAAKALDAAKKGIKALVPDDAVIVRGHGVMAKRDKRGVTIKEDV